MMDSTLFRQHIAYNNWATNRLLGACGDLWREHLEHDFGTADKTISGTMLHLFRSDRVWLQRFKGEPNTYARPEDNWESLNANWPALQQAWTEWVAKISGDDLAAIISYHDLKGIGRMNALWESVLQVVNHGTHHRGQVSGFLRSLGFTPPVLDYIAFVRERP